MSKIDWSSNIVDIIDESREGHEAAIMRGRIVWQSGRRITVVFDKPMFFTVDNGMERSGEEFDTQTGIALRIPALRARPATDVAYPATRYDGASTTNAPAGDTTVSPEKDDLMKTGVRKLFGDLGVMYDQRRAVYGPSEIKFGKVMANLFPKGVNLVDETDWARMGIFVQIINKICRYSHDFDEPHADSSRDLVVYSAMLHDYDATHIGAEPPDAE